MIEQAFLLWSNIIAMAMPLWLMGLGLLLCQRVGLLQWGVEGVILSTNAVVYYFLLHGDNIIFGLVVAMLLAMLLGGLYFLLSLIIKINWVLSGLAVFFIGLAIQRVINNAGNQPSASGSDDLPFALHYAAPYMVMILLLASGFFLQRMKWGMIIRGLGDEPQALQSLYPIKKIQLLVNMLGMALIGLGMGMSVMVHHSPSVMGQAGGSGDVVSNSGLGWLLLVVVALSAWSPYRLLAVVGLLAAAAVCGNVAIGVLYGVVLLVFVFVLSRKDYFRAHAPKSWRRFFYPIID
ncbi:MAG: hypothetical protein QM529_00095 [Hydrotalea sp.]|nr:hypothetical protein [Hydrotalea sp.]